MKTKKEFAAKAKELKAAVEFFTLQFENARKEWAASGYNDDGAYRNYCEFESARKQAERDYKYYSLLAGDAPFYANQVFYTDWEPWEVIEIKTDRCIVIRKMKSEIKKEAAEALQDSFVPGGFCGHFNNDLQEWDITSNPEGEIATVRRHKDGCFYFAGASGNRFYVEAEPYKYYDYNF